MTHSDDLTAVANFAYEQGYLKRLPRAGWHIAGVNAPETVAAHSYRVAVLAVLLAHLEGADPGRAAMLALFHDSQETRIGDVPSVGKAYVRTAGNEAVTADQTADFPPAMAAAITALVGEYEDRESPEAVLARDADKLECLLQAREYQAAGNTNMQPWIDTSAAAVRSVTGKRLAALCQELTPGQWWAQAAAQYPQRPRAVSG